MLMCASQNSLTNVIKYFQEYVLKQKDTISGLKTGQKKFTQKEQKIIDEAREVMEKLDQQKKSEGGKDRVGIHVEVGDMANIGPEDDIKLAKVGHIHVW